MPENLHCRVRGCNQLIHAENFQDGMAKLRRHREKYHPSLFKKSIKKGVETRRKNRSK